MSGVTAAGVSAAASVATAGVSVAQAAGGFGEGGAGGGGAGGPQYGMRPGAQEDYNAKRKKWETFWKKEYPRLSKQQKQRFQRLKVLYTQLYQKGKVVYKEQEQEKVYRLFRDEISNLATQIDADIQAVKPDIAKAQGNIEAIYGDVRDVQGDIAGIDKIETTGAFKTRQREEELNLNKKFQTYLQDTLNAHQHSVARGDIGVFSSETLEQSLLKSMASKRDESGTAATKKIRDDMRQELLDKIREKFNVIGAKRGLVGDEFSAINAKRGLVGDRLGVLGGKTSLIPAYGDIAARERARTEGEFRLWSGTQFGKELARNAYQDYITKMTLERMRGEPDLADISKQYWTGPDSGGQGQGTSDLERALAAFGALGQRARGVYGAGKDAGWWGGGGWQSDAQDLAALGMDASGNFAL